MFVMLLSNQRLRVRFPPWSSKLSSLHGVDTLRDNILSLVYQEHVDSSYIQYMYMIVFVGASTLCKL